jgi:hypothetical protein
MIKLAFIICIIGIITFLIFNNHNKKKDGASSASKIFFGLIWLAGFIILAFSVHNSEQLGLTILVELTLLLVHISFGYLNIRIYWRRINRQAIEHVKQNREELGHDYANRSKDLSELSWDQWLERKNLKPSVLDHINILAARGMFWLWFTFVWILEFIWDILTKTGPTINKAWKWGTRKIGKSLKKEQDDMWKKSDKDQDKK